MFSTDFTARFNYKNTESYYGFAVDYRGVSPIVYIIVGGLMVDVGDLDARRCPCTRCSTATSEHRPSTR
jgi:hypothetical protein